MSEWKPIESAPGDEAVLLAWRFGLGVSIAHRDESGKWHGHEGTDFGSGTRFTHWMPLPEPPND